VREVPRDGLLESGTIGPGLTLGTDQGGTPHESGFGTPRAVAGPRCGAPRAVAGPRFDCHASALPNALTQASHSVREEGAHAGAPHARSQRREERVRRRRLVPTRASAIPPRQARRTHIARRAEGTEVLAIDVAANYSLGLGLARTAVYRRRTDEKEIGQGIPEREAGAQST